MKRALYMAFHYGVTLPLTVVSIALLYPSILICDLDEKIEQWQA